MFMVLQIEDAAGVDEVTLTRKFGNEECVIPHLVPRDVGVLTFQLAFG